MATFQVRPNRNLRNGFCLSSCQWRLFEDSLGMSELLTALALAVALEGVIYALFPDTMRRFMLNVLEMSDNSLRVAGMFAAIVGVAAIAVLRLSF